MTTAYYRSPIGTIAISRSDDAISAVQFTETEATGEPTHPILRECVRQLDEYFTGKRREFSLALRPQGTPFQQQVWEALMSAAHMKLDNLTLIVDHNKAQQSNLLERVLDYRPLADKLRAFHWHVEEIDGHDMSAIVAALARATAVTGRPQAIVAHTVKGKGVSFVEADWTYHGRPISASDLPRALDELKD